MTMPAQQWILNFYYIGAGSMLVVTAVRYMFGLFHRGHVRDEFVQQMKDIHLPYIYNALTKIGDKLDIELPIPWDKPS